jgi:hypothetical protein
MSPPAWSSSVHQGALISGTAYDQMKGKLDLPLDYVGEQQVKNMPQPVRTYRSRAIAPGEAKKERP